MAVPCARSGLLVITDPCLSSRAKRGASSPGALVITPIPSRRRVVASSQFAVGTSSVTVTVAHSSTGSPGIHLLWPTLPAVGGEGLSQFSLERRL